MVVWYEPRFVIIAHYRVVTYVEHGSAAARGFAVGICFAVTFCFATGLGPAVALALAVVLGLNRDLTFAVANPEPVEPELPAIVLIRTELHAHLLGNILLLRLIVVRLIEFMYALFGLYLHLPVRIKQSVVAAVHHQFSLAHHIRLVRLYLYLSVRIKQSLTRLCVEEVGYQLFHNRRLYQHLLQSLY